MMQQVLQHYEGELLLYKELEEYMLSFKTKNIQNSRGDFSDKDLEFFKQGYDERLSELRRQESIRNKLIKEVSIQLELKNFSIRNLESTDIDPKVIQSMEEVISLLSIELQKITDLDIWIQNEISIVIEKTKLDIHHLQSAKKTRNAYLVKKEKESWYIDKNE